MRVRYKGDGTVSDGGPASTHAFGQDFPVGEWVEFDHPKFVGHPAFDVDGEPTARRTAAKAPEPDPRDDGDPDPDATVSGKPRAVADTSAPVEISENWQSLHWKKQAKLAEQISGEKPSNASAASAIIEAELARRA